VTTTQWELTVNNVDRVTMETHMLKVVPSVDVQAQLNLTSNTLYTVTLDRTHASITSRISSLVCYGSFGML